MVKVILRVGENEHVLCHGAARGLGLHVGPLDGFGHDSRIRVQPREYVDGSYTRPKARGNRLATVTLVVRVEFATIEECAHYIRRYPQELPEEGTVRFVDEKSDGSTQVEELLDAVIEDVYMGPMSGVSTNIRYTIKGSEYRWLN